MAKSKTRLTKKNTDDLIAGASLLFASVYVMSVIRNLKTGSVSRNDFNTWGNTYALILGLLSVIWSWNNVRRLRLITVAALMMLVTAVLIWIGLQY